MHSMPDRLWLDWCISEDAEGAWAFLGLLAKRSAHWEVYGKRLNMHRKKSSWINKIRKR